MSSKIGSWAAMVSWRQVFRAWSSDTYSSQQRSAQTSQTGRIPFLLPWRADEGNSAVCSGSIAIGFTKASAPASGALPVLLGRVGCYDDGVGGGLLFSGTDLPRGVETVDVGHLKSWMASYSLFPPLPPPRAHRGPPSRSSRAFPCRRPNCRCHYPNNEALPRFVAPSATLEAGRMPRQRCTVTPSSTSNEKCSRGPAALHPNRALHRLNQPRASQPVRPP